MATFNPFKGIEKAAQNTTGNYFPHGFVGRVEIVNVKLVESTQKMNVLYYVIETKVAASETHPDTLGRNFTVMYDFSKPSTLSNIRGFLSSALGLPFDEVGEGEAHASTEAKDPRGVVVPSPLVGVELELETRLKKTRAGGDFTVHVWGQNEDAE